MRGSRPPHGKVLFILSLITPIVIIFAYKVRWANCTVEHNITQTYLHFHHLIPDDGGSTHLWNVGRQLFYTSVHPRRQFWTYLHFQFNLKYIRSEYFSYREVTYWQCFISNLIFTHFLVRTRCVSAPVGPSSVVPQAVIYSCKQYTNWSANYLKVD
jgi:hypothetical protein